MNTAKQKKVDVKLANFLGGVDLFEGDEDDDMDDGLFSRKNRKIPVIPNPIPTQNQQPQMIQNQQPQMMQIQQPQMIQNQQPQMIQNQQPQIMQNQQPQMIQIPQNNPLVNLNNNNSNNLGNAKKKLKNMFGESDDDEDDENEKPLNMDVKKEEKKIENNIFKEDEKKVEKKEDIEIKEEKKDEEKVKDSKLEGTHKKKLLIIGDNEENNELKLEKKQSAKDQMVNSLFSLPEDEGEKNTSNKNVIMEQPNQIKEDKKEQKRLAFLFDDDD